MALVGARLKEIETGIIGTAPDRRKLRLFGSSSNRYGDSASATHGDHAAGA
jgi:hypothetical protein